MKITLKTVEELEAWILANSASLKFKNLDEIVDMAELVGFDPLMLNQWKRNKKFKEVA